MLIALFVLLLALITIGVPILLVMGIVGLSGILIEPGLVPALFPQKMFAMLDNFSLLALPYFILAGNWFLPVGFQNGWSNSPRQSLDIGAVDWPMRRWSPLWSLQAYRVRPLPIRRLLVRSSCQR